MYDTLEPKLYADIQEPITIGHGKIFNAKSANEDIAGQHHN